MTTTIRRITINRSYAYCPLCGSFATRHSTAVRRLHEIGILGPVVLRIEFSKHYCPACGKHFSIGMPHIAPPHRRYTDRVRRVTLTVAARTGISIYNLAFLMRTKYHVNIPLSTIHGWMAEELANEALPAKRTA